MHSLDDFRAMSPEELDAIRDRAVYPGRSEVSFVLNGRRQRGRWLGFADDGVLVEVDGQTHVVAAGTVED